MRKDYPLPQSSGLSRQAIEDIARRAAEQWRYTPGGNIGAIISSLGGFIRRFDTWTNGLLGEHSAFFYGLGDFEIILPDDVTAERDRFLVAQLLAHHVLHYHGGPMRVLRHAGGLVVAEAVWFAAELLMPTAVARDLDAFQVSRTCAVPLGLAEARVKRLTATM